MSAPVCCSSHRLGTHLTLWQRRNTASRGDITHEYNSGWKINDSFTNISDNCQNYSPTGSNAQTNLGVPHVFRVAVVGPKALDSEVDLGVENKEDGEGEYSVDYEVHVGQVDLN